MTLTEKQIQEAKEILLYRARSKGGKNASKKLTKKQRIERAKKGGLASAKKLSTAKLAILSKVGTIKK